MRVAAMDLGTNSFHLLVADVHPDGHIDPIVREKEMLRLGDVVSRHGSIPPTAADQAIGTVRRFRLLAEAAAADEVLARATSAIRRATNGAEIVDRIEQETGVEVEVISGHEEARLIFGAVRASVVLDPAPAICFDLGGGSLEVMIGDARRLLYATSLPLGVARLTAELVDSDPISKRDRRALRDRITSELAPVHDAVSHLQPRLAVGSSGTLEALAQLVASRRDEDTPPSLNQLTITRDEFLVVHKEILASTAAERLRFPGMDARRVDLVVAGSTVLATAMEELDLDSLTISEWALREGILLDAAASVHGLGDADRELLELAALLHDIGEHVASAGHHRHSAYLVRNGQLRGFAPDEIELLGAIVRWHRRGEPRESDEFPLLDEHAIARVRVLAALLRVADGLDRSREGIINEIGVTVTPSLVLIRPVTNPGADAELEVWGARRKRGMLEKVLDRDGE